jgi:ParB/RepB/Spo0J family partition protein
MPVIPPPVPAAKLHDWFKGDNNVREIVIDDGIRDLARSEADQGILQPLGAIDHGNHGETLYGFRRLAAYRWGLDEGLAMPDRIPVLLYPPSLTATQRRIVQATENLQRQDLTDAQKYRLFKELLELNPQWTRKDLAAHLRKHPSTITQCLSPDDLIPEGLQAFLDGKFGYSLAYKIAGSHDQAKALAKVLNGSSRADLEDDNRSHRNGHAPHPGARPSRIKIPVATSAATGAVALSIPQDGDLAGVETLLKEAEKALRLPRIKITPAKDDATGMVAVARESSDAQAETMLKEALKLVQDAKARKLTLKTAMVEWQDNAKAAHDAKPAQADQPDMNKVGACP